jgi:hypothetical protein
MELLIYDDVDFIISKIHYDLECDQTHEYFDLDSGYNPYDSPDTSIYDELVDKKIIKPKGKSKPTNKKPKPISNEKIAQQLLDEYWNGLINSDPPTSLVSMNDAFIFFYNSPTSEAQMATQIADKIAELSLTYNVGLTRPTFWSDDNQAQMSSFQSWQPDWETVTSDEFWKLKFPPLKRCRAKKIKKENYSQ